MYCDQLVSWPGSVSSAMTTIAPGMPRRRRFEVGSAWLVVAALIAAVPVAVAAIQALRLGWTVSSDDGVIATRAFDVFSAHSPLVGQRSQVSPLAGHTTYAPGPLLYWLLAVPARMGSFTMALTMALVSIACAVGIVLIAGGRGGLWLGVIAAVGVALACRSLPVEIPYEVWNPWAPMFPFMLLLVCCWAVGSGDVRLLPLLVLLACYVAETHFAYVIPALVSVAVTIVGLVVARRRSRPNSTPLRRYVLASALIALVCWSGPILDEIEHRPGNLVRVYELATEQRGTVGLTQAWRTLVRTIGVPPRWSETPKVPAERLIETAKAPSAGATLSAVAVLAVLLGLLGLALRRRRHDTAVALALALGLCAAVLAAAASVPTGQLGFAAGFYVLEWCAPAGLFVWLVAGCSAWAMLAPAAWRPPRRTAVAVGALGLAAVVATAAAIRDPQEPGRLPPGSKQYEAIRAASAQVAKAVGADKDVRIERVGLHIQTFETAIVYELRRNGVIPAVRPALARELGSAYVPEPRRYRTVVTVGEGHVAVPPGVQVVVSSPEVTVTLKRNGG
jgi:hypothetical protein